MSDDKHTGSTDVGVRYQSVRERLGALLRGLPVSPDVEAADSWNRPVPACPGWRVRDLLAHLVGNLEDGRAGRISGPPAPEQTAEQVARHRNDDVGALLASWDLYATGGAEESFGRSSAWPAFIDALTHEHDLRAALALPDREAGTDLAIAARLLADGLAASDTGPSLNGPGLVLALDDDVPRRLLDGTAAPAMLSTDSFTWFRLRMGRRTRAQVAALTWSHDPGPILDRLFVFGPTAAVVED